ncbi:hypothetical protein BV898_13390 [Hypsibius exemplaris]|uniref:HTH psq-type domain-containing protein n=1 Tax=Hypsibius exemplaris TaxID=2072580 RepID=A0A1W0WB13_HYPEX|nr:hypothetical protein BV898_13390 [Hypsibius exemplaris]
MSSALDEAIEAVIVGGVSVRQAAENFEIGRTTLHRHLEKADIGPPGRRTKFMAEEELVICDLLLRCAEIGIPLSKFHLKKSSTDYARTRRCLIKPSLMDGTERS